jgi:hypothetical protein
MIDAYSDAGGNVIGTAVNYRDGASEEVLGQLSGYRCPTACSSGISNASCCRWRLGSA